MLAAYVAEGRDVVLPQLIANESELARFEAAARDAGGRFVEVFLEADDVEQRFAAREPDQPWLEAVHQLVEEAPADHLTKYADSLSALANTTPGAIRLRTLDEDIDATYVALAEAVGPY
jgi:hypothetical protein